MTKFVVNRTNKLISCRKSCPPTPRALGHFCGLSKRQSVRGPLIQDPNLIEVLGKIDGHPEGVNGLVMSLVDDSYRNLAGPPSFESCTRDVYADDLRLSQAEVLRMASGIASVAKQLHANGIMHGDLYAHNILLGRDGHALLGDFGAACFKGMDSAQGRALEKIEVRAFGYLLEELLDRCDESTEEMSVLMKLRDACLSLDPNKRPFFAEIGLEV